VDLAPNIHPLTGFTADPDLMNPARATVLILLAFLAGCAVNPATGERELSFVGEGQEIAMGQQSDPGIVAQMGLYPDSAVQRYVRDIGLQMAAVSERPDLPWTFRVLDDPTVNAFALPGGFIYITRGILTHLTSEAQLAGILGHEIGHVTARHSVSQMSRTQLAQLGLVVGMVFSETVREYGGLAAQGLGLLSLSYGRSDELQADELGLRYMTRVGYEPRELAGVMEMLARNSELQGGGGGRVPEWMSTHPYPENRVERIFAEIESTPSYQAPSFVIDEEPFMSRLDGMVFGENPRDGFVADGAYHHPDLAFRFQVPEGWNLFNGREAVQLQPREGQGLTGLLDLRLDPQEPLAAAREFASQEAIRAGAIEEGSIHGNPAASVSFRATNQDGELAGEMTWIRHDGRTYAFLALSSVPGWSAFGPVVRSVVGSFQEEADPDILRVEPLAVSVVSLPEATAWEDFLRTYPSEVPDPVVAVINQVREGERLDRGPAKRVVR
jgi:predicted Zn-dependent protease